MPKPRPPWRTEMQTDLQDASAAEPKPRPLWRTELREVPPAARRQARYALQLLHAFPELRERLVDPDFLGALWQLLRPLLHADRLAEHIALEVKKDDDDDDDDDWTGKSFASVPQQRLRKALRYALAKRPRGVLKRLAEQDVFAPLSPTVAVLGEQLALDEPALRVLDYLDQSNLNEPLRILLRECGRVAARINLARLAALLELPLSVLRETLARGAPLRMLRLVEYDDGPSDLEDFLRPGDLLRTLLETAPKDGAALMALLVELAPPAAWSVEDFPHLAAAQAQAREALQQAAARGMPGVNALFYGPPGTGKTELARTLAAAAGLHAFQVRSADEDQDGLSREGRLAAYLLAQRLLARRRDVLILFDEVEDVFEYRVDWFSLLSGRRGGGRQKGWMNRILEENPVPAIWITNRTDNMDPAFLRRFLLPVPFVTPPRSVRRQMAERHLGDVALPPALLDELAADRELTPAQLGAARRLIELRPSATPETAARAGVAALRTLLHGAPAPRQRQPATAFDVAYLNLAGGLSPSLIAQALQREGRGTLCFYGPPGTGKTAFAEVLAEALDRELVARQASDLLSPYVGETEQNLAALFTGSDAACSVLLLDEVDSFLADRRQAQRVWERTQVNELLQQMERYPGIFIAATNLMSGLDAAALRRFDFKLEFRALTVAQRLALFAREALGDADAPVPPPFARHLERMDGLTPGDFATVCRQQRLLGAPLGPEAFLKRLFVEWQLKSEQFMPAN